MRKLFQNEILALILFLLIAPNSEYCGNEAAKRVQLLHFYPNIDLRISLTSIIQVHLELFELLELCETEQPLKALFDIFINLYIFKEAASGG